jgi:hypothetical protein
MWTGEQAKTNSFTITFWWESEGDNRDRQLGNPVSVWIGKNAKVLDKRRASEVIKELVHQFPHLKEAEARHTQLQHAKWRAP